MERPLESPPDLLRRITQSTPVKVATLGFIVLVLLIPVAQVTSLVRERRERQREVAKEVQSTWSGPQTLAGPILVMPYEEVQPPSPEAVEIALRAGLQPPPTKRREWTLHSLPLELSWSGSVAPEIRRRGLFETVVYQTRLKATGRFAAPHSREVSNREGEPQWRQAWLVLGVPHLKGLTESALVTWQGRKLELFPGTGGASALSSGLHVPLRLEQPLAPGSTVPFEIELVLRGAESLRFFPGGKETRVELDSSWSSPSFSGAYLPNQRQLTAQGFSASWQVPYLGRAVAQHWVDDAVKPQDLEADSFGVELFIPADGYQRTERSVKYAVLFILLTTLTFFLIELVSPVRLHALHYLLVGSALVMFYLLLLALSEHLGFGWAYLVAAVACSGLIAAYAKSILGNARWAGLILTSLAALYTYLYGLLQAEDYSLLFGALGLFAILALVMYLTRRLNWRSLRFDPADRPAGAPPVI